MFISSNLIRSRKSQNRTIQNEHIRVYRSRGNNLKETYGGGGTDSANREVDRKLRILIFERQKVCK